MKGSTPAIALVVLAALAVTGGTLAWRQLQSLQLTVETLEGRLEGLRGDLDQAEERARQSHHEAEEAELRAQQAAERAERAEAQAAELAERADLAHALATDAERQAVAEREDAAAAREQAQRAAAEQAEAQMRAEIASLREERARHAAAEARREADDLRRQRELQVDRLERALEQIAETRRTALGLVMNLGGSIEFEFDRAELGPENRELLSRIAGVLITAEDFGVQVFGHTDDVGTAAYNQQLSERRAQAVRDYLVEAGVEPRIISTQGFGKSVPLVEGSDEVARQRNRRVEIAVIHVSGELPADFLAEETESR